MISIQIARVFLVWNDKDLKAESSVAEKGKGE